MQVRDLFERQERTRAGFLAVVEEFLARDKTKRGHVEFVMSALKRLEEFHVEEDLAVYHRLLDVFPVNEFNKPINMVDKYWPRHLPQIEAATELLERMGYFAVSPTYETIEKLSNILGYHSDPVKKAIQIGWWTSMMQDTNPYDIGSLRRYRPFVLAGLVLKRIAGRTAEVQIVRVSFSFLFTMFTAGQQILVGRLNRLVSCLKTKFLLFAAVLHNVFTAKHFLE